MAQKEGVLILQITGRFREPLRQISEDCNTEDCPHKRRGTRDKEQNSKIEHQADQHRPQCPSGGTDHICDGLLRPEPDSKPSEQVQRYPFNSVSFARTQKHRHLPGLFLALPKLCAASRPRRGLSDRAELRHILRPLQRAYL